MKTFAGIAGAVAIIPLLTGCGSAQATEEPTARPVKVVEALMPEQQRLARYSVSIQAYEQVPIAFKVSGYVSEVLQRRGTDGRLRALQAGDRVAAGDIVARVRDADYREHVRQAASAVREVEVSQAKARADLDRAATLYAAHSLTRPELDAAQAALDTAAARRTSAEAQLALADLTLGDAVLSLPAGGVVLERRIETGTLVGPGTVAFVVGDVSKVKAMFGVPDSLVHRISAGQPLQVTTEAFRGVSFEGRVTSVAPSADPESRVFAVEITIPNIDGRLRPGMVGSIDVPIDGTTNPPSAGAAIPLAAIVRSSTSPDGFAAFVVEGKGDHQVARARAVSLGEVQGNTVAVTRGIERGDRVVVMGAALLVDGEPVRVIP
jgi:multidrug efflux system membrane fusion protein